MRETYVSTDVLASRERIRARLRSIQDHRAQCFVTWVDNQPVLHTQMQTLFNMKLGNALDRSIYEIIVNHATAAEKMGPGGFSRCLELLDEQHARPTASPLHATSAAVSNIVQSFASRGGRRTTAIVEQALTLAGFTGRIIVEKTTSMLPSVELVRGYTFELQPIIAVDANFVRPRIACIDGYVEEVAEIHHLLQGASEAKESCVLFVRGMSDDVKHTLKVNYDRGSLRVLPMAARFDLDGMNTLVDLSIVAGSDLISSLKGDLISSMKFEQLPYVDQATVYKNRVVVVTSRTRNNVAVHLSTLRKRRADEKVDDVGKLLDKRIRSLTPNHVVIRLPDDKNFVTNSQAVDYALRAVRSAIDHGVDEQGRLVATELAAWYQARQCGETLKNLGAYIT